MSYYRCKPKATSKTHNTKAK